MENFGLKDKSKIVNRGITLIALVVTIIVLLILAGVSIMMIVGNNGILTKVGQAKIAMEKAELEEILTIEYNNYIMDESLGEEKASLGKTIEKAIQQGYNIKSEEVLGKVVTGVEISNGNIIVATRGDTATVTITLKEEVSEEIEKKYYAKINGNYYEIIEENDIIKISDTISNISGGNTGGENTITVSTTNGETATATIEGTTITITGNIAGTTDLDVTVNGTTYSKIATITAKELATLDNISDTELVLDGAHLLTATISSEDITELSWSSANENIATVTSEGIVKCGIEKGETTIYCKGANKTLECKVTSTARIVQTNNGTDNIRLNGQAASYDNPTIPVGFSAIDTEYTTWTKTGEQTDLNKGLVIMDEQGNQFVWIPVENTVYDSTNANSTKIPTSTTNGSLVGYDYTPIAIEVDGNYKGILYNYDTTGGAYLMYPSATNYQGTGFAYKEPDIVEQHDGNVDYLNIIKDILIEKAADYADINIFKQTMQDNYNLMIEKVKEYGGFYIGRYESSLYNNTTRVISGKKPMLANESTSSTWYGLYARGKDFSTDYIQGSMIWGSQYDAIMNWMLKRGIDVTNNKPITPEGTKADYNGNRITGSEIKDKINNIFDLLGNSYEWSLETLYVNNRSFRGGVWDSNVSLCFRNRINPQSDLDNITMRVSFYVK